jgi:hypothetical protein
MTDCAKMVFTKPLLSKGFLQKTLLQKDFSQTPCFQKGFSQKPRFQKGFHSNRVFKKYFYKTAFSCGKPPFYNSKSRLKPRFLISLLYFLTFFGEFFNGWRA